MGFGVGVGVWRWGLGFEVLGLRFGVWKKQRRAHKFKEAKAVQEMNPGGARTHEVGVWGLGLGFGVWGRDSENRGFF